MDTQFDLSQSRPSNMASHFWTEVAKTGFTQFFSDDWSSHFAVCEEEEFNGWNCIRRGTALYGVRDFLYEQPSMLVRVATSENYINLWIAGKERLEIDRFVTDFRACHPRPVTNNEQIAVSFHYLTSNGPVETTRYLDAPDWSSLTHNYSTPVQKELDRLTHPDWRPASGGQLLLWQGPPGTGKTYAIRALIKSWRDWATASYVTDPDRFFSESGYMMNILLSNESSSMWRLIILEDAGELIAKDARRQTGQALSRLLNIADGLLGQGLRVCVLITTNEELAELHAAIVRPGRCASKLVVGELTKQEARDWCRSNELEIADAPTLLADLYALKNGLYVPPVREAIGFNRSN